MIQHQKVKNITIWKETVKLVNNGRHRLISRTIIGDKTYIPFFNVPTRPEKNSIGLWRWPQTNNGERAMSSEKVIYVICFRNTGVVNSNLKGQKTVNWYTSLSEIHWEVNARRLILQNDNASSHTSRLTVEFLEQKYMITQYFLIKILSHFPK